MRPLCVPVAFSTTYCPRRSHAARQAGDLATDELFRELESVSAGGCARSGPSNRFSHSVIHKHSELTVCAMAFADTVRPSARPMRGSSPGPQVPPCRGFSFSSALSDANAPRAYSRAARLPAAPHSTRQARRLRSPTEISACPSRDDSVPFAVAAVLAHSETEAPSGPPPRKAPPTRKILRPAQRLNAPIARGM